MWVRLRADPKWELLLGASLEKSPTFLTKIGLESLASDKHFSLLRKYVNYGRKKFYDIDVRMTFHSGVANEVTTYKTFDVTDPK